MSPEAVAWDAELRALAHPAPLLQSWAWGRVGSGAGWTLERVRLEGAMASVQVRGIGPVREAYVPRGPVPATREAVVKLVEWARERNFSRLRVEPEAPAGFGAQLLELGFSHAEAVQGRHTSILKLLPPDELLNTFRRGRRYNIRAGLRRGVVVEQGMDAAELARQTAAVEERQSIDLPDRHYYELLLQHLPGCRTYVARHPESGDGLAAVLVARHDGRGYSLFAGRTGAHSELMGNDVAWWAAISACAAAGCRDFDLWGIPPPGAGGDHPWQGLGAFKSEFNGEAVAFAGAWDLELSRPGARLLRMEFSTRQAARRLFRNIS